jgi:hypothetical protein
MQCSDMLAPYDDRCARVLEEVNALLVHDRLHRGSGLWSLPAVGHDGHHLCSLTRYLVPRQARHGLILVHLMGGEQPLSGTSGSYYHANAKMSAVVLGLGSCDLTARDDVPADDRLRMGRFLDL